MAICTRHSFLHIYKVGLPLPEHITTTNLTAPASPPPSTRRLLQVPLPRNTCFALRRRQQHGSFAHAQNVDPRALYLTIEQHKGDVY